jgi:hypothetical protein
MKIRKEFLAGVVLAAWGFLAPPGTAGSEDPNQTPDPQVPPGRLIPLVVRDGSCTFVLPTPHADDKYYLIVGSLSLRPGPFSVRVRTRPSAAPLFLPAESPLPDPARLARLRQWRERLDRARRLVQREGDYPPNPRPPGQRDFFIFHHDRDFQDPAHYVRVTGVLRAVGRHCQVYVDRAYADHAGLRPTVDDVVRTFDREVFPRARRALGRARDVDRDGRFTVLFTPWLGKMSNGRVSIEGFVRGSDFYRDVAAPFSNRCDVMYLNTDLKPGPYLRTLLAHEYTHAVVFTEHVLTTYLPELGRRDEESWLNEGLAHLAEDMSGYSWANLDFRVSAFLSAPWRYRLVVPDYYAAGLWRSHGNRGATYLFLRWCADRFGPDLAARLIQTNLAGIANLEVATGQAFADSFRGWSAALLLGVDGRIGFQPVRSWTGWKPILRPLGGRLLCGPRIDEMPLDHGRSQVKLAGTSVAYFLLHSPAGARSRVTVRADEGAGIQVSLLRLPRHSPRLHLRCEAAETPGSVRLVLTAHDADVTLQEAAWEILVPAANRSEDTSYRPGSKPGETVRPWFGNPRLKAGETRTSRAISLPRGLGRTNPLIIKVSAAYSNGRPCTAWARIQP